MKHFYVSELYYMQVFKGYLEIKQWNPLFGKQQLVWLPVRYF